MGPALHVGARSNNFYMFCVEQQNVYVSTPTMSPIPIGTTSAAAGDDGDDRDADDELNDLIPMLYLSYDAHNDQMTHRYLNANSGFNHDVSL